MTEKTLQLQAPGADAAALLLRLSVGPMLAYHGLNKVRGPGGLDGTTSWFEALGLRPAGVHARLAAATEMAAGTALTLGLASPVPSAAVVGLMVVAARTDHKGKGFFVFKGGWEYTGVVAATALGSAALGSGRWSIDAARGSLRRGPACAVAAMVLGSVCAAGLLRASYRPGVPTAGVFETEEAPAPVEG